MKRNLRLALLLTTLAMAFFLGGQSHQAAATTCDPEIPCACCSQGCYDEYDLCIASGTSPTVCASERNMCLRNCRFCV
jgi:hypothetical protein